MRFFLIFSFSHFLHSPIGAQTPWAKKAAGAVFTLKTFDANGALLASGNGFFTSENGEALSSFAPFKGASRAVIIDSQDKEWPVECLLGANDTYDVAKFKVTVKKTTTLTIATNNAVAGNTVWLLPYSARKVPVCKQGSVSKAEQFQSEYAYYTISMQTGDQQVGCPVLNGNGEVVGILQPLSDSKATTCYAVSARFANSLRISGLSINDPALRATSIAKALPDNLNEAILSLYVSASTMSNTQYADYIERFIQKFPDAADGYIYRARQNLSRGNIQAADDDMRKAVKTGEQKDDAHYQYAQLIMQKVLYQPEPPFESWTLDKALKESQEAYAINAQPVYRQLQAQILFAQSKYDEAYNIYQELVQGPMKNAETYYAAAQCKLQQDDQKTALALLDSAVNTFTKPYIKTAAPYLRVRAQLEMERRRYQQALDDMKDAVALEPNEPLYWAEKASYELRLNQMDDAMVSAQQCIRTAPESSEGYLLLGIAQCAKGQKSEGIQNLQKAKELGNDQAQALIDKYSK